MQQLLLYFASFTNLFLLEQPCNSLSFVRCSIGIHTSVKKGKVIVAKTVIKSFGFQGEEWITVENLCIIDPQLCIVENAGLILCWILFLQYSVF